MTGAACAPQPTRAKIRGAFERSATGGGEKRWQLKERAARLRTNRLAQLTTAFQWVAPGLAPEIPESSQGVAIAEEEECEVGDVNPRRRLKCGVDWPPRANVRMRVTTPPSALAGARWWPRCGRRWGPARGNRSPPASRAHPNDDAGRRVRRHLHSVARRVAAVGHSTMEVSSEKMNYMTLLRKVDRSH